MTRRIWSLSAAIRSVLLGLALLAGGVVPLEVMALSHPDGANSLKYPEMLPAVSLELNGAASITPTEMVTEMIGQVDPNRAQEDFRRLTGEMPLCVGTSCYTVTHRLTGSEGLTRSMDYLHQNLADLGYTVELKPWSRSGYAGYNLIARLPGLLTPTEEIYLVAHVDGVKSAAERYPAADDNASGVVNGLELARILAHYTFGRTVVLFFSSGEEQGTLGVSVYLNQLTPAELETIKYVINRDMTGYDANGDSVMEITHGDHSPSLALAQVMSETIAAYRLKLAPRVIAGCG